MPLSDEKHQIFRKFWAMKRKGAFLCPFCQNADWLTDYVVAPPLWPKMPHQGVLPENPSFPLLVLSCMNCHLAYQFSWMAIEREVTEADAKLKAAMEKAPGSEGGTNG